ncbi:MAG TPA: nickel-dependent hydrogenase large subunit [Eggerthellaceae bacterium]|nr:nickel-dependent hydrogenase large subunit [Eggerthellaceae bacterium]
MADEYQVPSNHSIIDPITRIEGHMRVEMEVTNGKVTDAWVSGGSFRGMEKVVEHRKPEDAAQIVQRICGVCPVSHAHASTIAAEKAYGIKIPNRARIIRNLLEGAQFLHSHILWLYNLAALDYVNPIDAVVGNSIAGGKGADVEAAYALALQANLSTNSDLHEVMARLKKFAENGQLSIFSGNWFDTKEELGYPLNAEANLILTSHYLEALKMQARSSEVAALLGGKMPHVMTIIPGGTAFVPTTQKLDDLWAMVHEIKDWVDSTMLQDTLLLGDVFRDGFTFGQGCGRFGAWGVFERGSLEYNDRYMPAGVIDNATDIFTKSDFGVSDIDESLITEYVGHSWYEGSGTYQAPDFTTNPAFTSYDLNDRYTWCKAPAYDGKPLECTSLSRVLMAYARGQQPEYAAKNKWMVDEVNSFIEAIAPISTEITGESDPVVAGLTAAVSMLGRTAIRQVETKYIAQLMCDWTDELIEIVKGGSLEDLAAMEDMDPSEFANTNTTDYFEKPRTGDGSGSGFWEAPRGALYHSEKVSGGKIDGYQIIIPTTWNLAPHAEDGTPGPIEQALIGIPVEDMEKPINALRVVHSYDPCVSCAVHVSDTVTGKHFSTVTNPWGVK